MGFEHSLVFIIYAQTKKAGGFSILILQTLLLKSLESESTNWDDSAAAAAAACQHVSDSD